MITKKRVQIFMLSKKNIEKTTLRDSIIPKKKWPVFVPFGLLLFHLPTGYCHRLHLLV